MFIKVKNSFVDANGKSYQRGLTYTVDDKLGASMCYAGHAAEVASPAQAVIHNAEMYNFSVTIRNNTPPAFALELVNAATLSKSGVEVLIKADGAKTKIPDPTVKIPKSKRKK